MNNYRILHRQQWGRNGPSSAEAGVQYPAEQGQQVEQIPEQPNSQPQQAGEGELEV